MPVRSLPRRRRRPGRRPLGAQRADLGSDVVVAEGGDAAPERGATAAGGDEGEVELLHPGPGHGVDQVVRRVEGGVDVRGEAGAARRTAAALGRGGCGGGGGGGGGGRRGGLRGLGRGGGRGSRGRGPGRASAGLRSRSGVDGALGIVDQAAGRVRRGAVRGGDEADGGRLAGRQLLVPAAWASR